MHLAAFMELSQPTCYGLAQGHTEARAQRHDLANQVLSQSSHGRVRYAGLGVNGDPDELHNLQSGADEWDP